MALPERTLVVRAILWWLLGLAGVGSALAVTGPSTDLYLVVRRLDLPLSDWASDVLIVTLALWLVAGLWFVGRHSVQRLAVGLAAGSGVVVAYGSSELLKMLLAHERPCRTVVLDADCPAVGSWSFPSNHSTIALALATAVGLLIGGWAWSAYLLAILTAMSRVVDGVHFPHDILAGAMLGVCTTVAVTLLLRGPVESGLRCLDAQRRSPSLR